MAKKPTSTRRPKREQPDMNDPALSDAEAVQKNLDKAQPKPKAAKK